MFKFLKRKLMNNGKQITLTLPSQIFKQREYLNIIDILWDAEKDLVILELKRAKKDDSEENKVISK